MCLNVHQIQYQMPYYFNNSWGMPPDPLEASMRIYKYSGLTNYFSPCYQPMALKLLPVIVVDYGVL